MLPFMGRCCGVSPFHPVKGEHGNIMGLHHNSATVRLRISLKAEAYFRTELLVSIRYCENEHIYYCGHSQYRPRARCYLTIRIPFFR